MNGSSKHFYDYHFKFLIRKIFLNKVDNGSVMKNSLNYIIIHLNWTLIALIILYIYKEDLNILGPFIDVQRNKVHIYIITFYNLFFLYE